MSDPAEDGEATLRGVLHAAGDVLAESTRAVADLVAAAGSGAGDVVPAGMTTAAGRMVTSLQQVLDLTPPVTRELDVLVEAVHAQRLSVQALQAQLTALDDQLEVLERALAPLQALSHQWRRLLRALADRLGLPAEVATGPPERAPTGHGRGGKRARDRGHSPLSDPIAARETL